MSAKKHEQNSVTPVAGVDYTAASDLMDEISIEADQASSKGFALQYLFECLAQHGGDALARAHLARSKVAGDEVDEIAAFERRHDRGELSVLVGLIEFLARAHRLDAPHVAAKDSETHGSQDFRERGCARQLRSLEKLALQRGRETVGLHRPVYRADSTDRELRSLLELKR